MANKTGNIIYNNFDRFTGHPFNTKVLPTNKPNGSPYTDADVDNVIIFKNTTGLGGGYSKRIFQGAVDVRSFGAVGDYNTATGTGTDDTAAINYALSKYNKIEFPAGYNFFVTADLNVTLNNTTISGYGTITQSTSSAANNIFNVQANYVTISYVTIIGTLGDGLGLFNGGKAAVWLNKNYTGLLVEYVTCIKQSGVVTYGSNNSTVRFCNIQATQMGIHFSGIYQDELPPGTPTQYTYGNTAENNVVNIAPITPRLPDANIRGIRTTWAGGSRIDKNDINGFNLDIECWRTIGENEITSNITNNNVSCWISYDGMGGVIHGNNIDYSIRTADAAPAKTVAFAYDPIGIELIRAVHAKITNNTVKNIPGCGILSGLPTQTFPPPVNGLFCEDLYFDGNTIINCGVLGRPLPAAALGNARTVVWDGGSITNCLSGGMTLVGSTDVEIRDYKVNSVYIDTIVGDGIQIYYARNITVNNATVKNCSVASNDPSSGNGIKSGINTGARAINVRITGGDYRGNVGTNDIQIQGDNSNPNTIISNHTRAARWGINNGDQINCKFSRLEGFRVPATALPIIGNYVLGETFENASPNFVGKMCTVAGTMGTLIGVTATGTSATNVITVNTATYLLENNYITIAGQAPIFRILKIVGNVVTLNAFLSADVTAAAVAFSPATFVDFGRSEPYSLLKDRFLNPTSSDPQTDINLFDVGYDPASYYYRGALNGDVNFPGYIAGRGNNTAWVGQKAGSGGTWNEERLAFSDRYLNFTSTATVAPGFTSQVIECTGAGNVVFTMNLSPTLVGIEKTFKNSSTGNFTISPFSGVSFDGLTGAAANIVLRPGQQIKLTTSAKDVWYSTNFNPVGVILRSVETLLNSNVVTFNGKTTGATQLFLTRRSTVITRVDIYCTAATAITEGPSVDIGGAVAGDIYPNTLLGGVTSLNDFIPLVVQGKSRVTPAATAISLNNNTVSVGTSQAFAVNIYGYEI